MLFCALSQGVCGFVSPQDLMAYGDVYCSPVRAEHYHRQPWINITISALLYLVGLELSVMAENGNV